MRILSVLTCCFGLALFAGAAQQDDQGNNKGKKKGGGNAPSQTVAPSGGRKLESIHKPGSVSGTNLNSSKSNVQKWKGPSLNAKTGGNVNTNVSGNAASTKFNKGKFSSQTNVTGGNVKFQKKHFNLQTNVVNTKYKTVNFNQNYKIAGAQKWKGAKYQVFVNYQPQWHDQWWWTSHHNHIVFVFGGWYFWNSGYWYPAWGYDPGAVYYYDGPIYASNPEEDPGQVVANVQSALQEQGYYQGEIDGVLGPETRAALAEYQSAQGLEPTGAVDEPTLETLGMA
jgi:hypothetical protein